MSTVEWEMMEPKLLLLRPRHYAHHPSLGPTETTSMCPCHTRPATLISQVPPILRKQPYNPALWALQSFEPAPFVERAKWKKAMLSLSRKDLSPVGIKGGECFKQGRPLGLEKRIPHREDLRRAADFVLG